MQKHLTHGINFKRLTLSLESFILLWILRLECLFAEYSDAFIANLMK